jgi:ectoine hydroxylase-related dioxygenase (phytanoyl-CoA dioxygenase family)
MKSYGISSQNQILNDIDYHVENIKLKGFSIRENVITNIDCDKAVNNLEKIYKIQENDFKKENLEIINELDMARMPFLYDDIFLKFIFDDFFLTLAENIIGKYFHIHLQNGIINRPTRIHHQTSWHRDLPYQNWTSSKPLSINAFYCLTDFTSENGATAFLPYSHRFTNFPSEKFVEDNLIQVIAPKGSVIYFDSMVYHRASINMSDKVRIGLNNMLVVPIIKQQINFSKEDVKNTHYNQEIFEQVLGFKNQIPNSVNDFRKYRLIKKEKNG